MTKERRTTPPNTSKQVWQSEINDLIRGASGGFLFGIPLMYTMEVWWIGTYTDPPLMLAVLAATFIIVFLLNRTDGFRQINPDSSLKAAMDTVEALAIGIICTTLILLLLNEIAWETPLEEALGKIVFESVPFSLGVALARSLMNGNRDDNEKNAETPGANKTNEQSDRNLAFGDIGATLVGAIFIAFNVAPTDEITMLAAAVSPPRLLAFIAVSLLISYGIVFVAGFTTQEKRRKHQGLFQRPLEETIAAYLVSLVVATVLLWFFHRLDFSDPGTLWLRQAIVLGLPATIGGAAGRITV
jgi:putative integral membrane protein (TIGR02587 family)